MNSMVYERLHNNLTALGLNTVANIIDSYLNAALSEGKSHMEILDYLLNQELLAREAVSLETRTKMAGFPVKKSIDDFDFTAQPSIDKEVIAELRTLRFVHNAENVIFLGPPGVGKTHLAIGLGMDALKNGFRVYFISAPTLINKMKKANRIDKLERLFSFLRRYSVLIVDEIGYLPIDREGAYLFFQLISRRYEHTSTIFTSNRPYSHWGEILGDEVIAAAVLDRILHHSTTVNIKGESYRLKAKKKAGIVISRISGGGQ